MKSLDWDQFRVILAISRAGSLTIAARILGMDQTTVGRRLTSIENALGTTLFVRAKTGFLPTDDGRAAISHAQRIEAEVEGLSAALTAPEHGAAGVVRALGNTWMLERLAAYLPSLLAENPHLELRFSGRLPPAIVHGEATVALWFDAEATPPDRATAVSSVPYAAYVSQEKPPPRNAWVQFRDDDVTGPSFVREMRRRLGAEARVVATATDARILMSMIEAGVGQGVLPTCLGDAHTGLTRSTAHVGSIDRVLNIHVRPDAERTPRVKAVIAWMQSSLGPALSARTLKKTR